MASTLVRILALGLLMAVALSAAATAEPAAPLGHSGRWLTDSQGRVVTLHGWNIVDKIKPVYSPASIGFDDDDAAFLAANGFNSVRLGIVWAGLEPKPGVYDDAYLSQIANTARILGDHGIHVLVDFHQDMYNERFNGEGAPDWAVLGDAAVLPAEPDQGFPANYLIMPALSRAYDYFWQNALAPDGRTIQDHYADAWKHAAAAFADNPMVFGFDIFNEPWPGTGWQQCANPAGCPAFDTQFLSPFSKRVFERIRQVDGRRLLFYEPNVLFNDGAQTHHEDTGDDRAGMSFHTYCLGETPGLPPAPGAADTCRTGEDLTATSAIAQSDRTGDAILNTEFAATDSAATIERVIGVFEQRMVSWEQWAYWNTDPCCQRPVEGLIRDPSKPPTGDNVKQEKLAVSARVYPQAVAGTPTAYAFDRAAKQFVLDYDTKRAGGGRLPAGTATEIFVPRLHYPHGYDVGVQGGRVTSRPGADVLTVVAAPGAQKVRVVVTAPGGAGVGAPPAAGAAPAPRECVPRRARATRRGLARLRLGATPVANIARAGRPVGRRRGGVLRHCVAGAGEARVAYRRGRAALILSDAKGHRAGRARPGASSRRALKRAHRVAPRLYARGRTVIAVRGRRVAWVGVADRELAARPGLLRRYARRAGY